MNTPVVGLRVASVAAGLACLAHLVRLLAEIEVMIAGYRIPMWWSGVAVIVAGLFCVWLWKLTLPAKTSEGSSQSASPGHPTVA